jgi:hypothetical protein
MKRYTGQRIAIKIHGLQDAFLTPRAVREEPELCKAMSPAVGERLRPAPQSVDAAGHEEENVSLD